jgi:hypothetical protein
MILQKSTGTANVSYEAMITGITKEQAERIVNGMK